MKSMSVPVNPPAPGSEDQTPDLATGVILDRMLQAW